MLSASQYTALQALVNCPGPTGATGATGQNGINGTKGDKGDTGNKGDTGDKGATGPGTEISNTFSVRGRTASPWFEWSIPGTESWVTEDLSLDTTGFTPLDSTNTEIRGLIFNGTIWVCSVFVKSTSTSNFPQFLYSTNGKNWFSSPSTPFGTTTNSVGRGAYNIEWNGRMFVAVGTSGIAVSIAYSIDNGLTWTAVADSKTNVIQYGRGIAWNGKVWMLTGKPAVSTASIAYSLNGVGWTPITGTSSIIGDGWSIATDGTQFIAGGTNSRPAYATTNIYTSSGWTSVTSGQWNISNISSMRIVDLGWNGRQWLLIIQNDISGGPTVATSTDGINWTSRLDKTQFDNAESLSWNSYAWTIVGQSATASQRTLYSRDAGTTWTTGGASSTAATSVTSRNVVGAFYQIVPYINVKDFGALGDGVTNDTTAINSAIQNASQYTNGARVVVPAGAYRYAGTLTIPANLEFVEETGAKIVDNTDGTTVLTPQFAAGARRVRIIRNDDENNQLSSYNGVLMSGVYPTGGGNGNDLTRSIANMFDINSDKRYVGIATTIVTGTYNSSDKIDITTTGSPSVPSVSTGDAIVFNSANGNLSANTIYYIRSLESGAPTNYQRITLSATPAISLLTVTGATTATNGTLYNSNAIGTTITGRTIVDSNLASGGRAGVEGRFQQTAATNPNNQITTYSGISGISTTSSGDGGTAINSTIANSRGQYFGGKFATQLTSGATNVRDAIGGQFDVTVPTGTSSRHAFGVASVASISSGTAPLASAAYEVGTSDGNGWNHGILFSDVTGGTNPLKSGGSVIGTYWNTSGTRTITNGIDLSGFEMTGNVLASPRLQITDVSTDPAPIIQSTTTNEPLTIRSNGSGALTLASPNGNINIGSGSTNYIQTNSTATTVNTNLYANTITSAATGNVALALSSVGTGNITLNPGGTTVATIASNGVTLAQPLAMGSNSISGATNITASGIVSGGSLTLTGSGTNVNSAINSESNITTSGIVYAPTVRSAAAVDTDLNLVSSGVGSIVLKPNNSYVASVSSSGLTIENAKNLIMDAASGSLGNIKLGNSDGTNTYRIALGSNGSANTGTAYVSGNLDSSGNITAGSFSGPLTGNVTAGNSGLTTTQLTVDTKSTFTGSTLTVGSTAGTIQSDTTVTNSSLTIQSRGTGTVTIKGGSDTNSVILEDSTGADRLFVKAGSIELPVVSSASTNLVVKNNTGAFGDATYGPHTITLGANGASGNSVITSNTGAASNLHLYTNNATMLFLAGQVGAATELLRLSSAGTTFPSTAFRLGNNTSGQPLTRTTFGNAGNTATIAYVSGTLDSIGSILMSGGSSALGFTTGSGGTVTQTVDKSNTVTLNRPTGRITMASGSISTNNPATFTLTNSTIAATDMVVVQHVSGGTAGAYTFTAFPNSSGGSADITVRNVFGNILNETIVLRFAVIKSADA